MATPMFTTKEHDASGQKHDKGNRTGVDLVSGRAQNVEFHRDVEPILRRSCTACHRAALKEPAGKIAFDDEEPIKRQWRTPWIEHVQLPKGLPRSYVRLVQLSWAFQSRRSPLIWKVFGERLDGFANEEIESPQVDYENEQDMVNWAHHSGNRKWDVDFKGSVMPPPEAVAGTYEGPDGKKIKVEPLSHQDKLTLVRWIDLGCPIDFDYNRHRPDQLGRGWMLDEGRPTLTLALPGAGMNDEPVSKIVVGMYDYFTGIDPASFEVAADFEIDGVAAGENLAPHFEKGESDIHAWKLKKPLRGVKGKTLIVRVRDVQGNQTEIVRRFSVK